MIRRGKTICIVKRDPLFMGHDFANCAANTEQTGGKIIFFKIGSAILIKYPTRLGIIEVPFCPETDFDSYRARIEREQDQRTFIRPLISYTPLFIELRGIVIDRCVSH